jgi:hypothetical protein
MDWTTLSGLYPDVATYTGQLRALEDRCRRDPKAAAPRVVLAYHYLAAGHNDAAVAQLRALITLEPGDRVARRLLASLTLKAEDRPPLRTSVTELSPDSLRLKIVGGIPGDPGLGFRRVAMPAAPDRDQRGGPRENR